MTQHLKALKKETQKSLNEIQENMCQQAEDLKEEKNPYIITGEHASTGRST